MLGDEPTSWLRSCDREDHALASGLWQETGGFGYQSNPSV
jgi:hypothetical protein